MKYGTAILGVFMALGMAFGVSIYALHQVLSFVADNILFM